MGLSFRGWARPHNASERNSLLWEQCGNSSFLFDQDCTTNSVQSNVHQGMGDTLVPKAIL